MASLESRITAPTDSSAPAAQDSTGTAPTASDASQPATWAEDNGQMDGTSGYPAGGGIDEPEFDVEVKLIDQTSPLYSVKTFEELGM